MSKRYSVNELVSEGREVRRHWIWDEKLPEGGELDEHDNCRVCGLRHPSTAQSWRVSLRSGEATMIEERHEGHEFVLNQNHGSTKRTEDDGR
ncbi:MAG: hypothetical protein VX823_07165 [Actinomycetota bacterium]|nr:hypothetical protein [Acidimicrobiales bacterium]MCS5683343.1 hypothetical protein [Acidimicrobiales bacterium]MEC7874243.1 hypothetical protein [Actinomycetota bacterium]MEC8828317.1 hypothetical protein [Actinomycetota bacterium]MEC8975563.1 hypothetical protein [Actinomycetota bacterium]